MRMATGEAMQRILYLYDPKETQCLTREDS